MKRQSPAGGYMSHLENLFWIQIIDREFLFVKESNREMKLYGNPVLPFSRLVETVAQFTKTSYDFQVVDLFSGQS